MKKSKMDKVALEDTQGLIKKDLLLDWDDDDDSP